MPEKTTQVLLVPDDFSYLDPDRPEIRYESDLTPEERERMAPEIAAMHERAAKAKLKPPWTITYQDGLQVSVGESRRDEQTPH